MARQGSAGWLGGRRLRASVHRVRLFAVALVACLGVSLVAVAVAEASPPVNTKAPTISGTDKEGRTLTAHEGSWSGTVESFSYVWQRCTGEGECANIESGSHVLATGTEYTLTWEDVGMTLRVAVTAHNSSGNGEAASAQTKEIAGIPPKKEESPVISGLAENGQLLSVSNGTWGGTPATKYSYLWESCAKSACKTAAGPHAEASYRVVTSEEEGKETLRAVVTDESRAGNASATSAATAAVTAGPPVNTVPPTISGEAREGEELKASAGTWVGTSTITYEYEWVSCNSLETCAPVGTGASYAIPGGFEFGNKLKVTVTAKNLVGSASATSAATSVVVGNQPVNTKPPTISGEAREGQELTASAGTWTGAEPITFTYAWKSCDEKSECKEASGGSYHLTAADIGNRLKVTVTAMNSVGSVSETSAATAVVVGNPPVNTKAPAVSGEAREGQELKASAGTWTGTEPIAYTYTWKSCNEKSECKEASGAGYHLTAADVGNRVEVVVTAKNLVGSASEASAATAVVVGNPPSSAKPPLILGEAREGQELRASTGAWTGTGPIAFTYAWKSCDEKSECKEASGDGYSVTSADVGNRVEVAVTAKNSVGSASESSAPSAVVQAGGDPVAWGANKAYELGAGYRNAYEDAPVAVREANHVAMSNVVAIAASYHFSLGLLSNGEVRSWGGDDVFSQLGAETRVGQMQTAPLTVDGLRGEALKEVKAIAAGGAHAAALMKNGTVMAWGNNQEGELGNGELNPVRIRFIHGEEVREETMVATAANHAEEVKALEGEAVAIAVGGTTDYALMKNGTVMAWGGNEHGELGVGEGIGKGEHRNKPEGCETQSGETSCSTKPMHVCATGHSGTCKEGPYLEGVEAIAAGANATYALLDTGEVVAWGVNTTGQLGDPSLELNDSDVPVKVSLGGYEGQVVSLSAGNNAALALLANGEVLGWGKNEWGQLGKRTGEECKGADCLTTPTKIEGLEKIKAVSAGGYGMSLALTEGGELLSLGHNFPDAQLGDGSDTGPQLCGEVETKETATEKERKQKAKEEREVSCSEKPMPVAEHVSAIAGGDQLNVALLEAGFSGSAMPLTLAPVREEAKLNLEWTLPGPRYFVSWRGESVETQIREAEVEQLREAEESLIGRAKEANEEAATAEEEADLKEAKKLAEEIATLKEEIKEENKANKWAKNVKIEEAEKCGLSRPCDYVVSGLVAKEPYEVRLKVGEAREEGPEEEEGTPGTRFIPGTPE